MRVGAIVQARMNSERLPGKVLYAVMGKPILEYLLERLDRCALLNGVVVATSMDPSDDSVEQFCREQGRACVRGSLPNVARRFRDVLDTYKPEAFVRISGDSPLLDPKIVDRGIEIFLQGTFDLVTNVFPRSFPRGQSVEVVRAETFRRAIDNVQDADELEHVTLFFYRNPDRFRIRNFSAEVECSHVHLAIDTVEDLKRVAAIVAAMERPHWEYGLEEVIKMYTEMTLAGGARG
jgi:spore coat polysaccharide biosynthesis protein SpsF